MQIEVAENFAGCGFIIPTEPKTKKNHGDIHRNVNTGKPFMAPSKQFKAYQEICGYLLPKVTRPIDFPVEVKAIYYMATRRRVDKTNLESALLDVLVHYGILKDDNSNIVVSTDGSRVKYDKQNPRTEVYIRRVEE